MIKAIQANPLRRDIQGLRGLAVLAIIAFDCKTPGVPGGFIGVDVFLVLSGYLTTRLIERNLDAGSFSYKWFYMERLRRIVPALFAVVLFCLALGSLVLSPWEAYRIGQTTVASALFASNFIYLIRGSFFAERAITYPLLMTWPLGVAMQFYLLLPLFAVSLRKRSPQLAFWSMACLSGLSLSASVYAEFHLHIWNFYLPVTRAWEMGTGSMLALWGSTRRQGAFAKPGDSRLQNVTGAVGLLALFASFLAFRPEMRFPGYEALLPVLGSILILVSPESLSNRILAFRPLAAIGLISFSLYLWHWPLLSFDEICSGHPLHAGTTALVLILTTLLALASYLFLERPFRSTNCIKPSRSILGFAVTLGVLACLGFLFFITKGLPARSPVLYGIESRAALYRHYPCISSGTYLRLGAQCAPEAQASIPAVVVLGGGHAEAFAEGLRDYLQKSHWQLITLTRESCPPLLGVSQWNPKDSTLRESCRDFNRAALAYVLSRSDVRAVVLVGRWRGPLVPDSFRGDPTAQTAAQNAESLKVGLAQEAEHLTMAGKHVIVVQDTPEFPFDPVSGIRNRYLPFRRLLNRASLAEAPASGDGGGVARTISISADEELADAQVKYVKQMRPTISLIDPKEVFCDSSQCRFASGENLFFSDSIHLSRTGALQIVPLLPNLNALR